MARILVIDDEKHIRDLYSLELSTEGYQVETSASCSNLLKDLALSEPNLIILDIRLVDADGLDVLLKIRELYPDLPVIMCSAYDSYRYDVRTIAADAYVVKSFDLSELKLKIQRALDGHITVGMRLLPTPSEVRNGDAEETASRGFMKGVEWSGLR